MPHRLAHAAERRINRIVLQAATVLFGLLIGLPMAYQWTLILAPRSLFFTVTAIRLFQPDAAAEVMVEIRRSLPLGPVGVGASWEVHDSATNENLCTRNANIVLEGPRALIELAKISGCDPAAWAGRRVVVQGHLVKVLDFGIRKEQLFWSPEFEVPTTWRAQP